VTFIHDDREFPDLVRIVADERKLSPGLVEKDYWVTHCLWALHECGLEVWFKGGTSLSKGFGLIERFSEDLDLKIEPGSTAVPRVDNWKSKNEGQVRARRDYFGTLSTVIQVPGATVQLEPLADDPGGAVYRVEYRGRFLSDLPPPMLPFVKLEVGNARVTPFEARNLSSFVHDRLVDQGLIRDYDDNRPRDVRCMHPLVTLIEKLNAISHGCRRERDPAGFVRHYEDSAKIIVASTSLPPLAQGLPELVAEMVAKRDISHWPKPDDPGWTTLTEGLQSAHAAIEPFFWGRRRSLAESCEIVREWIVRELSVTS
jgi:hypothetical protein